MKKINAIGLLALSLSSACAPDHPSTLKKGDIDSAFLPLISSFEDMYGGPVVGIDIVFAAQESPTIGMCKVWDYTTYKKKVIEIDPEYWHNDRTSDYARTGLMYHELGHCLLDRDHTEDKFYYTPEGKWYTITAPSSIMYPTNFFSKTYEPIQSYYFTELLFPETRRVDDIPSYSE